MSFGVLNAGLTTNDAMKLDQNKKKFDQNRMKMLLNFNILNFHSFL